jgi:hypothetical protein
MTHRIGHEYRQHEERSGIEDELRDEHRPQQMVLKHEHRALLDLLQRMASRRGGARRFVNAREQHHRNHGEGRRKSECRRLTDPSHQYTAQRRSAGKGDGARQFDPRVRRR